MVCVTTTLNFLSYSMLTLIMFLKLVVISFSNKTPSTVLINMEMEVLQYQTLSTVGIKMEMEVLQYLLTVFLRFLSWCFCNFRPWQQSGSLMRFSLNPQFLSKATKNNFLNYVPPSLL